MNSCRALCVMAVFVLLPSSVAVADDMGWLQPGVRVWYAGISASGSQSDAEEAYLIERIENGAARVIKHSAINFWGDPFPPETIVNNDAASDGEFWINPDRLRAMKAPDPVSWRGLPCLVKAHVVWGLEDDRIQHLLPIVALFELNPQREIVVLSSQAGAYAEYYFDVETGLLLSRTESVAGYTRFLTLAEINYDFATHQAFPEDRGPHTHFHSYYSVIGQGQTFVLDPVFVGRYGSQMLAVHRGMFLGGNFGFLPFNGLAKYDAAQGTAYYNSDYTFFSENWQAHGDHFYAWIPAGDLTDDAIRLQYSTLYREQPGTALAATGTTFSTSIRPADFDVVTVVFDADGFATDLAIASTDHQFYLDSRTALRTIYTDGPDYFLNTMIPAVPGGRLDHIKLKPASASIPAGSSQTYTAKGFDAFNNSLGKVTAATTFSISPDGSCTGAVCTATVAGLHTVTGNDAGKIAAASLTVMPGSLHHITLSPAGASVPAGGSQTYTAEGFDAFNNSLGAVTAATAFSISPDGSCTGAVCTATVAGPHTVTGNAGGKLATATLTVTAGALDRIKLKPPSASIPAGGSQAYTVKGLDAFSNSLGKVTAATVFSISPDGSCTGAVCTATVAGPHTVTGNHGGKLATASLSVTPGPLDHIKLKPPSASIPAGGSQTYTANGFDAFNNGLGKVTGATTFSISPDGSCTGATCTATVPGPHTVTGNAEGKLATADLTVTPSP